MSSTSPPFDCQASNPTGPTIGNRHGSASVPDPEIAIAPWYPDRAGVAMDKGLSLAVAYPKEGAVGILPAIIIPKGTAKLELAHKFLDQILSAEGQGCFSERAYIGAVNTKVKLSEKLQKIVPYGPTLEKAWFIDPEVVAKSIPNWTRRWQREVAR